MDRRNIEPPATAGLAVPGGVGVEALFTEAAGFLSSGVVVLTTVAAGIDYGMTATSFVPVSFAPPIVLACVANTSRFRGAVAVAGSWSVSILPETARELATWFASRRREARTQFHGVRFTRGPRTGAPLLADALAALECSTQAVHPGGDHSILVGKVVAAWVGHAGHPLVRYLHAYHSVCTTAHCVCGRSAEQGSQGCLA